MTLPLFSFYILYFSFACSTNNILVNIYMYTYIYVIYVCICIYKMHN